MKMHVIIFLTLIIAKNILCDESNESRYIDLLPEKEKEQFLQKIARRIFDEAEVTDDQYKQSREVPDDQLNEHTDFVQKILREESANLRKTTKNKSKEDEKSDESIRVKPLEKYNTERVDDNQDRYVDLTLRQGSRKKRRDNFITDVEQATEGKINVDVRYDTEENKVIENGEASSHLAAIGRLNNSKEDSIGLDKEDESSFEDIQVKHFIRQGTTKNSNEVVSSTNLPRITKIEGFDAESAENFSEESISSKQPEKKTEQPTPTTEAVLTERTTTSFKRFTESIYEPIGSQEIESITASNSVVNTQQTPIIEIIPPTNSTEIQYVNNTKRVFNSIDHEAININITEDKYVSKENATNSTSNNNEYDNKSVNRLSEDNTLLNDTYNSATADIQLNIEEKNDEMTTKSSIELTTHNTLFNDTYDSETTDIQPNIEEKNEETTIKNILESITNSNDSNNIFPKKIESNSSIVEKESRTEKQQIQITDNITENTNKNESYIKIDNEEISATTIKRDVTKNNFATTQIPGDVAKALRQRLLDDDEKSESDVPENEKRIKSLHSVYNKNKQTYRVYELPPNQEPFVFKHSVKTPKNQEAPQYVPIYNYSVNNAYFTAKNRYGPNFEDNSERSGTDVDDNGSQREDDNQPVSKESYGTLQNIDDHRKFRFGNKQNPKPLPNKIIPVVNQKEYYPDVIINPDDYLDNDYYFGRTNINLRHGRQGYASKIFPDSSDESHPSANGIKDHIRSVRKILFENKFFGYVPDVDNTTVRPAKQKIKFTISPPLYHVKRQGENNIEEDYYSETLKQDDQLESNRQGTKIGYVKYNNVKRDLRLAKRINKKMLKNVGVIKFNHKLFYRDDIFDENKLSNALRERVTVYSAYKQPEYFDTIYKVLKLTNEVDLFPTLNKMRDMNIPYMRNRQGNEDMKAYVDVLNDILRTDTKALVQYNWLETTVEIQSAINRLMEMTEQVQSGIHLHPADLGLLKYVVYLYQTARTTLILKRYASEDLRSRMIPKSRKRIKSFLKEKGLLNRVWLFKRDNLIEGEVLNDFKHFLNDLESALYDLHNAVKHIAIVTKYNKQAWFENLQRIYMKEDRKHLLEVILHLSANRLFGLIEDSAENGAEVNYVEYMKNNDLEVGRSVDECVFVLRLLDEIKSLDS